MIRTKMERRSPVHLPGTPAKTKMRDHWPVVAEYVDEGPGPWVVDLSHCRRWDIQGGDWGEALPSGFALPDSAGRVALSSKGLTGRIGRRQALLWLFDDKAAPPAGSGCTEITEGTFCLALLGSNVFQLTEKLTHLDLGDPQPDAPFLRMGPFSHITCQVIVLKNDPAAAAVLIACSRGFAHDMVHAVWAAGEEFGLRPAGESRFLEKLRMMADTPIPSKPEAATRTAAATGKSRPSGRNRSKKTAP